MRSIVVSCFVLIATLGVQSVRANGEDSVLALSECIRKALSTGLPDIGLPSHNPLHIWKLNTTIPIDIPLIGTGVFKLDELYIEGLIDYNFTKLEGNVNETLGQWYYEYEILYPSVQIHGEWDLELESLINVDNNGTVNITLDWWTFSGVWNMTWTPDDVTYLNDFVAQQSVRGVEVKIDGNDTLIGDLIGTGIQSAMISETFTGAFSGGLLNRFNSFWLAPDARFRILAIIENC